MRQIIKLKEDLKRFSDPKKAKLLQGFFKTGKGEYGEGDVFLGVKVPDQRTIAKKYNNLNLSDLQKLLSSNIHEYRMIALMILVLQYINGDNTIKEKIFKFYLKSLKNINNWDLIDTSAPKIIGDYLSDKPKDLLYQMAKSKKLWQKRIAIISTFAFIKNNNFKDSIKIAKILLKDKHDLIHKAAGWTLRVVGNKNLQIEKRFLDKYYKQMPRTMLRYAIEKFPEDQRKFYLNIPKNNVSNSG